MAQSANYAWPPAARTPEGMTARWFDPHRLSAPPTGYVRAIGAAAALTLVLVVLLVLDVAVPDYDINPGILLPLLGATLALLGLEASALWRGVR
jgi:hypothetical protein